MANNKKKMQIKNIKFGCYGIFNQCYYPNG
jgi:hypothetical protein